MTIQKAIEIQTIHNNHNPNFTDADREKAHQLGIEALKRYRSHKVLLADYDFDLLPGED